MQWILLLKAKCLGRKKYIQIKYRKKSKSLIVSEEVCVKKCLKSWIEDFYISILKVWKFWIYNNMVITRYEKRLFI